MRIFHRMTGIMAVNSYLLVADDGSCALIDPVGKGQQLREWIAEKGGHLTHILLTHGHFDHIGAVDEMRREGAKVYIQEADGALLMDPERNMSAFFGRPIRVEAVDVLLQDGDELRLGNETIHVLHTPGHTPGGACYVTETAVFSGDTLFYRSVGRSDFPGGDYLTLVHSIKNKLFSLTDRVVYPGHGKRTTIAEEREQNPCLEELY